jgi:hypothetical protein
VDIQKASAWATIGSFFVGCVALYIMWSSKSPQSATELNREVSVPPLMWLFLGGLVLSGGLHAYAAVVQAKTRPDKALSSIRQQSPIRRQAKETPTDQRQAQPNKELPSPFDSQTTHPDGRTIINCTPEDLQAFYRASTIDQTTRLLTGKWLKMSGKVDNVHGDARVYLEHHSPMIVLRFAKGWEEQLSMLRRGSSVTFRGKIKGVDSLSIDLEECELV